MEDHLLSAFEFKPLDMLAPPEVEAWKHSRLAAGAKAETVAKELRTLKAIIHHAIARDAISRDPLRTVRAPRNLDSKPHRFYEKGELIALYAAAYDKQAVWKLLANTGLRRAEAQALRWKDVGKESIHVLSTEVERTKSMKWRDVPLSAGALEALDRLKGQGPLVLPQITPPSLSRSFVKDASRAGLDGSLHTLRHTYISHLVRLGVPLRTVQIYAGHSHYATTEKYVYLSPGAHVREVTELDV